MKDLNAESLFNIFKQGDEEIYNEYGLDDILNSSVTLIGTVIKGVENYYIMDQMYIARYHGNYDRIRASIKLKYFEGLIVYLNRVSIANSDSISIIRDEFEDQAISYAFDSLLEFYEELEMYERCSVILKIYQSIFEKV